MISPKPRQKTTIPLSVFVLIKSMIRERTGLIFEGATEEKLRSALLECVPSKKEDAFFNYYERLQADPGEFDRLLLLLTINETFFFRERAHLELLTDVIVPKIRLIKGMQTPIKVMSTGCSTGEEAYSIAIALHERFGPDAQRYFRIFAGDIDKVALEKARQGIYRKFSFRGVDRHIINKYFEADATGSSFLVKSHIKQMVSFDRMNLLSLDYGPQFSDIDVMFYRNVSIYFDEETRKKIIERLSAILEPNGFLIMGSVETLANDFGVLHLTSRNAQFFFAKARQEKDIYRAQVSIPEPAPKREPEPSAVTKSDALAKLREAMKPIQQVALLDTQSESPKVVLNIVSVEKLNAFIHEERWDDALRLVEALKGLTKKEKYLYLALILMNQRNYIKAENYCHKVLAEDEWSLNAQVILGLSAKYQEAYSAAAGYFKKAAYLDSECWLAQYHLADCLRQLGQSKQAHRVYSLVLNLTDNLQEEKALHNNEITLPFTISVAQVKALSNLHMDNLKD